MRGEEPKFLEGKLDAQSLQLAIIGRPLISLSILIKGHGKTRIKPPYGWCFSQGELVKDQREYPIVQLIESLWKQGRTVGVIVRYLNGNGYRSRLNRDWGYGVIKGIIKRLKSSWLFTLAEPKFFIKLLERVVFA